MDDNNDNDTITRSTLGKQIATDCAKSSFYSGWAGSPYQWTACCFHDETNTKQESLPVILEKINASPL